MFYPLVIEIPDMPEEIRQEIRDLIVDEEKDISFDDGDCEVEMMTSAW